MFSSAAPAQIAPLPSAEVAAAKVVVEFAGQQGEDGGGPRRHCFTEFGKQLAPDETAAGTSSNAPTDSAPPLFKRSETGRLVPSSAETLMGRVGTAEEPHGPIVPTISSDVLSQYHACGRVCGLALVNKCQLGLPFARYFVRLLLGYSRESNPRPPRSALHDAPRLSHMRLNRPQRANE